MPSFYLSGSDLDSFGVPSATPIQVGQASGLVDSYLKRPEGLIWKPDFDGLPAFMAGLTPSWSGALTAPVAPGTAVVIASPLARMGDVAGEVLILDRENQETCEAVTITGNDAAAGTITLACTRLAHAAGTTVDRGLTIGEERSLPARRSLTRISRPQFARVLGGAGRYGYGRRSDANRGFGTDFGLLAIAQSFGSVPIWEALDPAQMSVSATTGEVWVPAGFLMAYFSDVRLRYVAGFAADALPDAIKQATASLVSNLVSSQNDIGTQIRVMAAGGSRLERFSDSNMDADVKAMLEPYRARVMA
jgi:hypothetical protein